MKIEEKLETAQVERGVMEVIVGFIVGRDLCLCFIVCLCAYVRVCLGQLHRFVRQCVYSATLYLCDKCK